MRKGIPTRRASLRQEKQIARELGGRVQPNSGATDFYKGDVMTDNMLIECKTVMKPQRSITVKKNGSKRMSRNGSLVKKDYSAVVFDFGDGQEQYYSYGC